MEMFKRCKAKHIYYPILVLLLYSLILVPFVWAESPKLALKGEERHFRFNQQRNSIRFLTSSTFHPVKGEAKEFKGEIMLSSRHDPSTGRVTLEIQASSLDAKHKGMNKKMGEDCLEVDRFPLIRFQSLEIRNGPASYSLGQTARGDVVGFLDLHGVKKKISIPVNFKYTEDAFSVQGKVTQIPAPKLLFLRVKDEVEILFDIHGFASPGPT
jgi:polyisoprenoid-binding protein YceI